VSDIVKKKRTRQPLNEGATNHGAQTTKAGATPTSCFLWYQRFIRTDIEAKRQKDKKEVDGQVIETWTFRISDRVKIMQSGRSTTEPHAL
jgi:hypothetical protein